MVSLSAVKAANTALVTSNSLVAVIIGGTSGIGANTVKALAARHGESKSTKTLRLYIVGRNAKAAERIIAECRKLSPLGNFIFVKVGDLALIKDVDLASKELVRVEEEEAKRAGDTARIDILFMTAANFDPFGLRKETSEGLDTFMSLVYYSRMRFILNLLPLLKQTILPEAHITSVYGPGRDTTLIESDLSLRDVKNYSFWNAGCHIAYFTTLFMEHLASKHAGKISLVHYSPGVVFTEGFTNPDLPLWLRWFARYFGPLLKFVVPMVLGDKENGDRTLFTATARYPARGVEVDRVLGDQGIAISSDGTLGGGAYRVNYDNELVLTPENYVKLREEGWTPRIVEHTMSLFEVIESGKRFED